MLSLIQECRRVELLKIRGRMSVGYVTEILFSSLQRKSFKTSPSFSTIKAAKCLLTFSGIGERERRGREGEGEEERRERGNL